MTRNITMFVTGALLLLTGGLAMAQEARTHLENPPETQDVTEYKFSDDVVEGDLLRPDGTIVPGGPKHPTRSLIRVRKHFIPEMLKTVEDL